MAIDDRYDEAINESSIVDVPEMLGDNTAFGGRQREVDSLQCRETVSRLRVTIALELVLVTVAFCTAITK